MEKNILDNMQHLVAPVLARLTATSLRDGQKAMLTTLEERLSTADPTFYAASVGHRVQTDAPGDRGGHTDSPGPQEQGDRRLPQPEHCHRKFSPRNLRRKLDLRNTSTNLRSFLLGLNK